MTSSCDAYQGGWIDGYIEALADLIKNSTPMIRLCADGHHKTVHVIEKRKAVSLLRDMKRDRKKDA